MRVTALYVKGYRTLKDVRWKPGALNVVIGPNASGKSNLLKFLHLVSASARAGLSDHVLREGGMGAMLWDGRGEEILFEVPASEPEAPRLGYFAYDTSLRRLGMSASFEVREEGLSGVYDTEGDATGTEIKYLMRTQDDARYQCVSGLISLGPLEVNASETLLGQLGGPTPQAAQIKGFRQFLAGWSIYDNMHTESGTAIRQAVTSRHDEHLDADGQNLASILHTHYTNDVDFEDRIDEAMRAASGRTIGAWPSRPPPTSRSN